MFASGMHYTWTSPSLPKLYGANSTIEVDSNDGSWLASISLLGDLVGAPVGAYIADHYGRKGAIYFTATPYLVAWIMIALADNLPTLLIARFIAGIGDGSSYTILPMYVGEISDNDIRGRLGNCIQMMADLGALCMYSIGPWISIRTMALLSSSIPILLYIVFPMFPESPYHLLLKEDYDGAKKSLEKLRGRDVEEEFKVMRKTVLKESQMSSSWGEIFVTKSNFKALMILIGLKTVQQMSGISAMLVYTELIFQEASGGLSASVSAIIVGAVLFIFSLVSAIVVDYVGRKPLLIISSFGCAVALAAQAAYFYYKDLGVDMVPFDWLPVTAVTGYIIMYSFGLGAIPFMMPGELFPTNVKAKALCIMDIYLALIAFVVIKMYQVIAVGLGNYVPFLIFTVSCIFSIFFVIFCVPETKGRSLEEIQDMLKGIKPTGDVEKDEKD